MSGAPEHVRAFDGAVIVTRDVISPESRALIDDFIAANGVTRVKPGVSGLTDGRVNYWAGYARNQRFAAAARKRAPARACPRAGEPDPGNPGGCPRSEAAAQQHEGAGGARVGTTRARRKAMPFEKITPPDISPASKAPVKASITLRQGAPVVWLSISAQGQQDLFGHALAGAALDIEAGTGREQGQLRITMATAGRHQARPSIKDSVRIPVGAWEGVPANAVKSRPCRVVRSDKKAMTCIVELPGWRSGPGGK